MSMKALRSIGEELPPALREQVLGYAASIKESSQAIADGAGVAWTVEFSEKLAFLAGVRKLRDIVASAHWSLRNSSELLTMEGVPVITISGKDFSKSSEVYRDIGKLLVELEVVLIQQNVMDVIKLSYEEMAQWIAHERQ